MQKLVFTFVLATAGMAVAMVATPRTQHSVLDKAPVAASTCCDDPPPCWPIPPCDGTGQRAAR